MILNHILTDRLILIPITLEITKSLLDGSTAEVDWLGIAMDPQWPTADTMDILPLIYASLQKDRNPTGFETWMIVTKADRTVIGDIGFLGNPNESGEVEIGFGLVAHERGKGFGTESLQAMMHWLRQNEDVKVVKAACLIDNQPSARVLQKAGLQEMHRDDTCIYWKSPKDIQ